MTARVLVVEDQVDMAEMIVRNLAIDGFEARGVHAVCFSEIPPYLGLPSIHSGYCQYCDGLHKVILLFAALRNIFKMPCIYITIPSIFSLRFF